MAKIYARPNSPYWWVKCKGPDGRLVRRSLGIPAKEALKQRAELAASKLDISLWNSHDPVKPTWRFEDLMTRYITERQPGIADMRCIRNLRQAFVGCRLSDLTPNHIAEYKQLRRKKIKDATIRRELAAFSSAINYARREWGWEIPNVIVGRKPSQGRGRVRWLTRDEARQLLQAARESEAPHLVDFIELALHTGMRKQELLGLERSRIDLKHGVIHLNPEDQKSREYSTIPLNPVARQVIIRRYTRLAETHPDTPWLFPGRKTRITDVKNSFSSACQRAGITDFRIHDLRHTFASWLVQDGVPLVKVKALLRHASITTTEKYAHLAPQDTQEAVEQLAHSMTHSAPNVIQMNHAEGKSA